jgi:hypothetical protein
VFRRAPLADAALSGVSLDAGVGSLAVTMLAKPRLSNDECGEEVTLLADDGRPGLEAGSHHDPAAPDGTDAASLPGAMA